MQLELYSQLPPGNIPRTVKELAAAYKVHRNTIRRHLKRSGIALSTRCYVFPSELLKIVSLWGPYW